MTVQEWGAAFEDYENRVVALTTIGDATVLTLWIGRDDDPFRQGPPQIFGSIIKRNGEFVSEIMTPTEEEAVDAHALLESVAMELFAPGGSADAP
jgi:hypothetical protein